MKNAIKKKVDEIAEYDDCKDALKSDKKGL